jgi:hypothetical protein
MGSRITWPEDGPFPRGGSSPFHLWLAEAMESPSKMAAHRSVGRKLQQLDHVLRHGPVGLRPAAPSAERHAGRCSDDSVTATRRIALPRRSALGFPAQLSVQPGLAPRRFPSLETGGAPVAAQAAPASQRSSRPAKRPLAAAPSSVCCTKSCPRSWPAPPGPWPCCSSAPGGPGRPRRSARTSSSATTSWCLGALAQRLLTLSFQPDR